MTRKYKQKVQCPHCHHVFKTRTRATKISCGYCSRKFNRAENILKFGDDFGRIKV